MATGTAHATAMPVTILTHQGLTPMQMTQTIAARTNR
jgi:hypothetical protein